MYKITRHLQVKTLNSEYHTGILLSVLQDRQSILSNCTWLRTTISTPWTSYNLSLKCINDTFIGLYLG